MKVGSTLGLTLHPALVATTVSALIGSELATTSGSTLGPTFGPAIDHTLGPTFLSLFLMSSCQVLIPQVVLIPQKTLEQE